MLHTEFSESYNEENSTGEAAVIWQQREQKKTLAKPRNSRMCSPKHITGTCQLHIRKPSWMTSGIEQAATSNLATSGHADMTAETIAPGSQPIRSNSAL